MENINELIPIQENNGKKAVSARMLYDFLGCTERFQSWFDRQLQYGFTESVDYQGYKVFNTLANQELTDYAMTISMTKDCFCFLESKRDFLYKSLDGLKKVCTFAVLHFYIHIRIGDFLCPILNYCLQYKQRFLRTYSPQSRYGSVATWRKPLLSSYIINF